MTVTADVTRYLTCSECGEQIPYTATIRLDRKGEGPVVGLLGKDVTALRDHTAAHQDYDEGDDCG